jgi:hypothetical protein
VNFPGLHVTFRKGCTLTGSRGGAADFENGLSAISYVRRCHKRWELTIISISSSESCGSVYRLKGGAPLILARESAREVDGRSNVVQVGGPAARACWLALASVKYLLISFNSSSKLTDLDSMRWLSKKKPGFWHLASWIANCTVFGPSRFSNSPSTRSLIWDSVMSHRNL